MKSKLKLILFSVGLVFSLTYLSLAVESFYRPSTNAKAFRKSASTVPTGSLSEIQAHKVARPNFDDDLNRLSRLEQSYASGERIPSRMARTRVARARTATAIRFAQPRRQGTQQAGTSAR